MLIMFCYRLWDNKGATAKNDTNPKNNRLALIDIL